MNYLRKRQPPVIILKIIYKKRNSDIKKKNTQNIQRTFKQIHYALNTHKS